MARASLSVCCLTNDPGPRLAWSLGRLAEVADEIVVVADARVGQADLADYASVADRLLRIEFDYLERHLAWLHAQCSGDWILRLDGDEVVSTALIDELPQLIGSKSALQYWIFRRWLYPDAEHWLRELPWFPDPQLRLVRNDATLRFPGDLHSSASPTFPAGYVESPIYHLVCLLEDHEARRERALRYSAMKPGLLAPGGGEANDVYYVPEDHSRMALEPVGEDDRAAIAQVLKGARVATGAAPVVPIVDASSADDHWAGAELGAVDRQASLEIVDGPLDRRFDIGEQRSLWLRVRNEGGATWPWGEGQPPEIRIAHRWLDADGRQVGLDWLRHPFPRDVLADESVLMPVGVTAPNAPGTYRLHLDLVQEHVAWFGVDLYAKFDVG